MSKGFYAADPRAAGHPGEPPLGRPRTSRLPRPQAERASQFMPFAALTGYYDLIQETANGTRGNVEDDAVLPQDA